MQALSTNDPLRAMGFSIVPDGYSLLIEAASEADAIAAAPVAAFRAYGRMGGAVLHVERVDADHFEVVMSLRTDGQTPPAYERHPFNRCNPDSPFAGLDPNGITAKVAEIGRARGLNSVQS